MNTTVRRLVVPFVFFVAAVFLAVPLVAQPSAPAIAGVSPADSDLSALYSAIEAPQLDASIEAPARFSIGRAEVVPQAGARIWRMVARGRPCGIVLEGPASWSYRVEDRFSQPIARRNLPRGSRLGANEEAGGNLVLRGRLEGVAVWSWTLADDLGRETNWAASEPRALPAWARERLTRRFSSNPAHDLVVAMGNGDPLYAWALLHGEKEDFVLDWDARSNTTLEFLARAEDLPLASPFRGRWAEREIITQPIGRS